jgi:hypothetical protein
MARKPIIVFLIKIVPLFALFLYLWHARGLAGVYYRMLAEFVDVIYPHIDPTGTVKWVSVKEYNFGIGFVVNAKRDVLSLNATDITSNMAMLVSLYLASPIWRRVRIFLIHFVCSLAIIFFVHAFTIITLSREAFSTHPAIMALTPYTRFEVGITATYNTFYTEMGMYLVVLLLWFPYIIWCIRGFIRDTKNGGPNRPPEPETASSEETES